MSYKTYDTYKLSGLQGSKYRTTGRMIVVHSTANIGASAKNNASFEKRTWKSNEAYVHFIAGDGVVYAVGATGYQAWGAGATANALAPVQIEMEETNDKAKFMRIVKTTAELIRDMAKKYNVPLTLNASGNTGIKTHRWCSQTYGETDHTDPETYFSRMGYSNAKFLAVIKGAKTTTAKPTYFDWAPARIYTKQAVQAHTSASTVGTSKNISRTYKKGAELQVKTRDGHRFQLTNGLWITANKVYVNNLYYTESKNGVKVVESVNGTGRYKDIALEHKVDTLKAGTQFDVKKVVQYGEVSRILLANGYYISGNKRINKFVE